MKCGNELRDGAAFCDTCGSAMGVMPQQANDVSAPQLQQVYGSAPSTESTVYPSLANLYCPSCRTNNWKAVREVGSGGKNAGAIIFGAVGALVISSQSAKNFSSYPFKYKCLNCKATFESAPLNATPQEVLESPCHIVFTRVSSVVGIAVVQVVYLNGVKIGPVKNGQTIEFSTQTALNVIIVTDHLGNAFPSIHRFQSQAGGRVEVNFKRGFIT